MATTLLPPEIEIELAPSDEGVGSSGPPREPEPDPHREPERDPEPAVRPLGVYRALTAWIIAWIVIFFAALTVVVKDRWADGTDWVSVPLPRVLFWNISVLLASSVTVEVARSSFRRNGGGACVRWLLITLVLGLAFVGGQLSAWRELVSKGLYVASNPGSLFIYLITGTHGLHLLGGITALGFIAILFNRLKQKPRQQLAVDLIALYWHFMDGLWLYLLALLFITVER